MLQIVNYNAMRYKRYNIQYIWHEYGTNKVRLCHINSSKEDKWEITGMRTEMDERVGRLQRDRWLISAVGRFSLSLVSDLMVTCLGALRIVINVLLFKLHKTQYITLKCNFLNIFNIFVINSLAIWNSHSLCAFVVLGFWVVLCFDFWWRALQRQDEHDTTRHEQTRFHDTTIFNYTTRQVKNEKYDRTKCGAQVDKREL